MKVLVVLMFVCLAGLVCGQGMRGMQGMGAAGGSGSSAMRNALAMRMLSGRGGAINPMLLMMMSQGAIDSPLEMMACARNPMSPICLMMISRR